MVPAQGFVQPKSRKKHEDGQGNDLLNGFQFRCGKMSITNAVGGHLQYVFKKSQPPADQNDYGQSRAFVAQVSVPRKRHEHIGQEQEAHGGHRNGYVHSVSACRVVPGKRNGAPATNAGKAEAYMQEHMESRNTGIKTALQGRGEMLKGKAG